MSKRKPGGMVMSPSNGGGGSTSGGRRTPPTGEVQSAEGTKLKEDGDEKDPRECKPEPKKPMEVVFSPQTFRRLVAWTFGPLLIVLVGALTAFFYFYADTNAHKRDPTIHLTRGERAKFETKAEAKSERTKLKKEITTHFDVKVREIKVEQVEQWQDSMKKVTAQQARQYQKIMKEIRKQ
jgi:hypothetical protein